MFRFFKRLLRPPQPRGDEAPLSAGIDLERFQQVIGYHTLNHTYFIKALTHSSRIPEESTDTMKSNERLEFLGDAVLDVIISEMLFRQYPDLSEGELTTMRSSLVSSTGLANRARDLDLGQFLFLGHGEEKSGGRQKDSILANAYEAVIGAIYLDGGIQSATDFVRCHIWDAHETILQTEGGNNYKGELLEYCQKELHRAPKYTLVKEEGVEHKKTYTLQVLVGKKVMGTGVGKNKKEAEQHAAADALRKIASSRS